MLIPVQWMNNILCTISGLALSPGLQIIQPMPFRCPNGTSSLSCPELNPAFSPDTPPCFPSEWIAPPNSQGPQAVTGVRFLTSHPYIWHSPSHVHFVPSCLSCVHSSLPTWLQPEFKVPYVPPTNATSSKPTSLFSALPYPNQPPYWVQRKGCKEQIQWWHFPA